MHTRCKCALSAKTLVKQAGQLARAKKCSRICCWCSCQDMLASAKSLVFVPMAGLARSPGMNILGRLLARPVFVTRHAGQFGLRAKTCWLCQPACVLLVRRHATSLLFVPRSAASLVFVPTCQDMLAVTKRAASLALVPRHAAVVPRHATSLVFVPVLVPRHAGARTTRWLVFVP